MRHLVIGGAGFIGCNVADHFAARGDQVVVFDNFSRRGAFLNARWLLERHPRLQVESGDVRLDLAKLEHLVGVADVVYHLAAQVAVTTSVANPREDFEVNALGTFNVLEATRRAGNQPILIYASTNKVYGGMEDVRITERHGRYEYADLSQGIPEDRPLDFHSPYGCSKGAGDQYVRDYARIYGLRTVVCRQSCIYGPRQFGVEDQGWVAWFTIAAVLGKPVTIYGDGRQVRDVLFVEDLIRLYEACITHIEQAQGQVYNVGGGPQHTLSLLELVRHLEELTGRQLAISWADWRPGDQRVYISDIKKAAAELGWRPQVSVQEGIQQLLQWVQAERTLFS